MNKLLPILTLLLLFTLNGCSVTKWSVTDQEKVDNSDFSLLNSEEFISQVDQVSPTRPVLKIALFSRNEYEYKKKIEVERSIQRYQPRLGYMLFGLLGASASFYAANTTEFENSLSKTQSLALNTTGALLVTLGLLNSKPVGEPNITGERRLLRESGSELRIDTVRIAGELEEKVAVTAYYEGDIVAPRTERDFTDGSIEINLAAEIQPVNYSSDPDDQFRIEFIRKGKISNYNVPVSSVFQAFAEVKEEISPLRNEAEINSDNVLIDLAQGSQLELIEVSQLWTKVKYGTYESYISTDDINIIWRPSDFAQRISVIEVPVVPFGNIDIESNIPTLYPATPERAALIIANENYRTPGSERTYVRRDGRLMESYFTDGLGVREYRISTVYDFDSNQQVVRGYNDFANSVLNEESIGLVYIAGNGAVIDGIPYLLNINGLENIEAAVNLENLFEVLGKIESKSMLLFIDIDFSRSPNKSYNLVNLANILLEGNPNSAIIFGNRFGDTSSVYMSAYGEQKRHFIFPYFLAEALKEGNTQISEILNHLNRNVSYTSRRLFNIPQEIIFFGNQEIDLAQ